MLPVASPLLAAVGFDIVDGIAIDWMCTVCLGIARQLVDKWLNARSTVYFIGTYNALEISYYYLQGSYYY